MTRIRLARKRFTTARSSPRRSEETTAVSPRPASATESSSDTSAQRRLTVTPRTPSSVVATADSHWWLRAVRTSVMLRRRWRPPRTGTRVSLASPSTASTSGCTLSAGT